MALHEIEENSITAWIAQQTRRAEAAIEVSEVLREAAKDIKDESRALREQSCALREAFNNLKGKDCRPKV